MSYRKFQIYFFITILAASGFLTLLVFRSFLTLLAFAGVLAITFRPLYVYFLKYLRYEALAAFLTVICITFALVLPLAYFMAALSAELISLLPSAKSLLDSESLGRIFETRLPPSLESLIPVLIRETVNVVRGIAEALSSNLFEIFSNILGFFFGFFIVLFSAYYLLKDGSKVKRELLAVSPLGDEHDELVFERVGIAIRAVMGGVLIIALIKGFLAGVFFLIFGIPAPLLWGTMTGFASFLPFVGTSLVTVPAVAYLLLSGRMSAAIAFAIIAIGLVGAVDNFLQPKLVQSKTRIHPLLILLSILGGIRFYGFSGFILGPLTLAVTIALIDIYKKEFRKYLESAS